MLLERFAAVAQPMALIVGLWRSGGADGRFPRLARSRGLASIVFAVILVADADLTHESLLLNTIFSPSPYILCLLFVWFDAVIPIFPDDRRRGAKSAKPTDSSAIAPRD